MPAFWRHKEILSKVVLSDVSTKNTVAPQQAIRALRADTPNCTSFTSLTKSEIDGNASADYASLANLENDDNEVRWYPLNIYRSNPKKAFRIRDAFFEKGFTTYLRLKYQEVIRHEELQNEAKPVISNLIFVEIKKKIVRELKHTDPDFLSVQFMTKPKRSREEKSQIISVPQKEMQNFIDAETREDVEGLRIPFELDEANAKPGRKVRIIRGAFAGITGEIKNYKTHRIVLVRLSDLGLANAITKIPKSDLQFLE